MKKLFLLTIFFLFVANLLGAQNYNGSTVIIVMVDKTKDDRLELKTLVSQKINENFTKYAGFDFLDVENESEIRNFIRKMESSGEYDEKTLVSVGNRHFAEYVIFSEILKDGDKYSLSCNFTNLATGVRIPTFVTGVKTSEALYEGAGCAVNEITLRFCEQIGIVLADEIINLLKYGEAELSDDEYRKKLESDITEYQKRIQEINIQIEELKLSTDLFEQQKIKRLEMDRLRTEAKLQESQRMERRRQEAEKKKEEDAKKDAERSADQKKKRDEQARLSEEKISNLRKENLEGASMFSQINVIEAKKKVLTEIYDNTEADVSESNTFLQQELQEKISEINDKEYSKSELVGGEPTDVAKNNRRQQTEDLKNEYQLRMIKEEEDIRNSIKQQQKTLYNEIYSDYKIISEKRTITSVGSDLKYSIGEYNGADYSWAVTLYIYSDGIPLSQQSFTLKYKDLTGIAPVPERKKAGYNEYINNVDLYDSWFRRGDPILTFEVDYSAQPKKDEYPSQYYFNFLKIRARDTVKWKVISTQVPTQKTTEYEMPVVYDIRSFETKKAIAKKEQRRQEAEEKAERIRKKEEARLQRQAEENAKRELEEAEAARKREEEEARKRANAKPVNSFLLLKILSCVGGLLIAVALLLV